MNLFNRRLGMGLGLMLLGVAGPAVAQQSAPPNIHFIFDTSSSMRELPQVQNSGHKTFFDLTINGCSNPRLDAAETSRGWNPSTVYPVPDVGTGLGSDMGFPNLFQDSKFYGYMFWNDSTDPTPQWDSQEQACQQQVPFWDTTGASTYSQCLTCLSTKGYWKLPGATQRDTAPFANRDFIFWGRFLNFNPPKYVTARAELKKAIQNLAGTRAGFSVFTTSGALSSMVKTQSPACSVILNDSLSFGGQRASYVDALNGLLFTTASPVGRALLNAGYSFTSDDSVYSTSFNFGSAYSYPPEFKNAPLTSDSRSVCWGCQTNAVILITDGETGSADSFSSTLADRLRTVNGGPTYCPDSQPCASSTSLSSRDKGTSDTSYTDDNPNYYLDDVAKMLYQQDLQRSTPALVGDFDTSGTQKVITYTVGVGVDSNLLKNTAAVGGGLYFTADNASALQTALQSAISDVQTRAASCIYYPPAP